MALAVNLRYENKSYASAFDQSRRSLLLRTIRIALFLKLAVSVRMGLVSELRRHNVFRIMVLHAIVAWLI